MQGSGPTTLDLPLGTGLQLVLQGPPRLEVVRRLAPPLVVVARPLVEVEAASARPHVPVLQVRGLAPPLQQRTPLVPLGAALPAAAILRVWEPRYRDLQFEQGSTQQAHGVEAETVLLERPALQDGQDLRAL